MDRKDHRQVRPCQTLIATKSTDFFAAIVPPFPAKARSESGLRAVLDISDYRLLDSRAWKSLRNSQSLPAAALILWQWLAPPEARA